MRVTVRKGDPNPTHADAGRVMRVDIQVALGTHFQIEHTVLGKECEHVIEKTDTGLDVGRTGAVDPQFQLDLRLGRIAFDVSSPSHKF